MKKLLLISSILVLFFGCKKEDVETQPTPTPNTPVTLENLVVSKDFNFETSKKVNVVFNDFVNKAGNKVKYDIYLYDNDVATKVVTFLDEEGNTVTDTVQNPDAIKNKLKSIITDAGNFDISLVVPQYATSLYVVRNEMGMYSSEIVNLSGDKALYNRAAKYHKAINSTDDVLYAVNGAGDLMTINHSTGEMSVISQLPDNTGSYTCAIDPVSRKLYTVGNNYPKYSLYSYDIDNGTWETIGDVGIGGPRLGYNKTDGLLYFSSGSYLYKIDPSDATILSSYYIDGLQTNSGGDLTFDSDGTMYLSTTTGLYRCEFSSNNVINTTWISSESLPNYPNSLTFDSNGELWWATVAYTDGAYKGRVFIMDKVTGGWEDRFTPYEHYIHDLALLPYDENAIPTTDTDGDGIIDFYDEYPDDPDKAMTSYTPSIFGWGSYSFEDLWPYKGDYDFNDLVLNYRYTNIENADGLLVETDLHLKIKNIGGSYRNGFGIQLENLDESVIQSVTGYNLTEGIVNLNSKGLEEGQSKPTIIVFDNAWANTINNGEMNIVITYTSPISPDLLNDVNPFIFIDGNRGREIHMSNKQPTDLADRSLLHSAEDVSDSTLNLYYKNKNGLPWGINIIHDFVYPREKQSIDKGYPFFVSWASSDGKNYPDWYKEKTGYRDYNYLVQD